MGIYTRIRNGMKPNPATGEGGASEGDVRGSSSDFIESLGGVVDLDGGHLLVHQNDPVGMSVVVDPGIGYIPNTNFNELDSDQIKSWEAIVTEAVVKTIDSNTSGSTRIDLICLKMDTAVEPDEFASNIATLVVVKGTPGAGAPATPANHLLLAQVEVINGASEIPNAKITDEREQILIKNSLLDISVGDWKEAGESWAFNSADAPTFTISVPSDATTKYSPGMRIKLTHGGSVKYFIITKVAATILTLYGGTDYTLAAGAITLPYYSSQKSPFGFPLSPAKWTIELNDTTQREQTTPSSGVWYNLGSLSISIPIGIWRVSYQLNAELRDASVTGWNFYTALSTGNNNASDSQLVTFQQYDGASGNQIVGVMVGREKHLTLTSKTTYYINMMTGVGGVDVFRYRNELTPCIIRAICAYL